MRNQYCTVLNLVGPELKAFKTLCKASVFFFFFLTLSTCDTKLGELIYSITKKKKLKKKKNILCKPLAHVSFHERIQRHGMPESLKAR